MILSVLGEDPVEPKMVDSKLTSSNYWESGENHSNRTHLRPNSSLSQKQNGLIDVSTMVHQISKRYIQAFLNNVKLIIIDYLAA